MPPQSPAGPRLVAVFLLVGVVAAAIFWAWPSADTTAAPREEVTTPARATETTLPVSGDLLRSDRTAAVPDTAEAVAPNVAKTAAPAADSEAPIARVHGRVVDAQNVPIATVKVAVLSREDVPMAIGLPRELTEKRSHTVTTDARGEFSLPLHQLGPFELIATHDEWPDARVNGTAASPRVFDVVIVMQQGGTIHGSVAGAPADVGELQVVARPAPALLDAVSRGASGMLIDLGDLVEGLDVPMNARRATVGSDAAFVLHGLEPAQSYQVFGVRRPDGAMPVRCTERIEVRPGAAGVVLRWRETLAVVLRVVDDDTGAPLETLDVSFGPVHKMKVMGMTVPVPMRQPLAQHHFTGGNVRIDGIGIDDGDDKKLAIEVRAAGRRPWSRDDVDAATRGPIDLGTVRLAAAPIVRVAVTDAEGPVASATVRLVTASEESPRGPQRSVSFSSTIAANDTDDTNDSNRDAENVVTSGAPREVTTDAAGIAEVTADFAGRACLVVESSRHARFRGAPFDLPARGTVDQRARLVAGGTVRVIARDGHGAALANATVRRHAELPADDQADLQTTASGVATFEHVPPGSHRFALHERDDHSPLRVGVSLGRAASDSGTTRVDVVDGESIEVELQAPLRGSLYGVVTFDGKPLDRAEVRIGDASPENEGAGAEAELLVESMLGGLAGKARSKAKTDVDGSFAFDDIAVGARRLTVTHADLAMPTFVDVRLEEGDNVQNVALRGAVLRGRVVRDDGKPVEGASVSVAVDDPTAEVAAADLDEAAAVVGELFGGTPRRQVRTDADGHFELRGVRMGSALRVRASARLHVTSSTATPAIDDGAARDGIELRLTPAGRIRVKATGDNAIAVTAEWAADAPLPSGVAAKRQALLKGGRATLDGMMPGRWRVLLDGPAREGDAPPRVIAVTAGATVDVEL